MAADDCQISDGGVGGIGTQCEEMLGSFLHQQRNDIGTGIIVDSEHTQRSHQPLLAVRAHRKNCKVSDDDVPTRSTMARHVGGGDGSEMHEFGGNIP